MTGSDAEFRHGANSWGPEFVGEGDVRFRLWAPGQSELALRLDGVDAAMIRQEDGWFELLATGVSPGARYGFVLADGAVIPDPASRAQAEGVHGPSVVVDPQGYKWVEDAWPGRPWEEAVIYELHIGAFTPEGTFRAAIERLAHLRDLGVTAIEIMPVAHFAGERGWGYDGVFHYAPHPAYGAPDDMKAFVDAAHGHGLMVLLDVVYNHFGPEGNYLSLYAPQFFHPERQTPWGAAIAYEKAPVRAFFVENALYWLDEFRLDGLRFDAIDHIHDEGSDPEILVEIAQRIRREFPDRKIHLTTEDNRNITRLHERDGQGRAALYTAEWNDDLHNVAHVVATGETEGYYSDFAEDHWRKMARTLAEGFAYQGEASTYGGKKPRGRPSAHLPPTAFVDFLQNHDQVGNRAFGERLIALADQQMVRGLMAVLLLSPHIPLLFMGEETGETRPFCFFTDFEGELADAVRNGRRREFAHFAAFRGDEAELVQIPDPNEASTFDACKLDWARLATDDGADWLAFTRGLLDLRREKIVPLLHDAPGHSGRVLAADDGVIAIDWRLKKGLLQLRANLGDAEHPVPSYEGTIIFAQPAGSDERLSAGDLPAKSVVAAIAETNTQ